MGNAKKILTTRTKEFFSLWKHYSFLYAFYNLLWWTTFYINIPYRYKVSSYAICKKSKWLDNYLMSNYKEIVEKYQKPQTLQPNLENYIWVFWGQGEENMPPLVKACYQQLTHCNKNVKLVTNENLSRYIDLPNVIWSKVSTGHISWANYSDIIRNSLLAQYGGLWIDATVWVKGNIPFNKLNEYEVFSANDTSGTAQRSIKFWTSYKYNWSTWCLWSKQKGNPLYSFVAEMLTSIAIKEAVWPDYVIQDYLIYFAYNKFPFVDKMINEYSSFPCKRRNDLAKIMNEKWDNDKYQELTKEDYFFKLSFRANWKEKTESGEPTFYGTLISPRS